MDTQDRDRMTTVGELSTILAHEIKNPMNSIIINMEVLRSSVIELTSQRESPAAERAKKYLDVIEGEIKRLDKVIKGFLDFAAPQQNTKVPTKLNNIVQDLAEFVAQELKTKNIRLELTLDPQLPTLVGSPDQMKQALLNLILNSLQALPDGGVISIRSEKGPRSITLVVEDNGQGIDEKLQHKIFNPYFTTKAKGSGLGLTIVRRVVKEHGGNIQLESQTGQYTRFILTFPLPRGQESKNEGDSSGS